MTSPPCAIHGCDDPGFIPVRSNDNETRKVVCHVHANQLIGEFNHRHVCDGPFILVEYAYGHPGRHDGWSAEHCEHGYFARWCGKRLSTYEYEPSRCPGLETHPKVHPA